MLSREQIEDILRTEVEIAMERRRNASIACNAVVGDDPDGLPSPAGTFRTQPCSEDLVAASEQLRRALERFNGFLTDGVVPDDL